MSGGPHGFTRSRPEIEAVAVAKGCRVVDPGPRELFLDIDSEESAERTRRLLSCFYDHEPHSCVWSQSPSGEPGHWHVVVTLERDVRDMAERLLLQACLGSDPMRELLSWRRLALGCEPDSISVLFESLPAQLAAAPEPKLLTEGA